MLNRFALRMAIVIALSVSAITITACQATRQAEPEMLIGDGQLTHERHATGIDSHALD